MVIKPSQLSIPQVDPKKKKKKNIINNDVKILFVSIGYIQLDK